MLRKVATNLFFNSIRKSFPVASYGTVTADSPRVAVVLSGCGVYDGSEVHEAVSVLSHITRNCGIPVCFAPDYDQMHVINHLNGEEDKTHKRYVLQESARISRGQVHKLNELIKDEKCFDALVFPGGFGVAKNLTNFAVKGADFTFNEEVLQIIKTFHCAKKPMAFICIAPIMAAKAICNVNITLGKDACDKWPHRGAILEARKLGALVENRDVNEYVFDKENLVFSTPAFMYDGLYHEIDDGIGIMIKYMMTYLLQTHKN